MTQEPDTQAFTPEQLEEIRDIANEIAQSKMPRYFRKERVSDESPSAGQAPVWDEKRGKWVPSTITGGASPTDATYLTTLSNPTLTNETVVGLTPGGELGGEWGAPSVDVTHSGSPHHPPGHSHSTEEVVVDHDDLSSVTEDQHHLKLHDHDATGYISFGDLQSQSFEPT